MTIVSRAALREGLTAFVRNSPTMESLDQAMRLLYRDLPRPSMQSLAELVLLSIVRGHEVRTRGVLGRLNEALARVLDDLDALRAGRAIEGRPAALRSRDLASIDQTLRELRTLEQEVRELLEGDESWAAQLRSELTQSLGGPRPTRRPTMFRPTGSPRIQKPAQAMDRLRRALLVAGADPAAVMASGRPSNAVLQAAHGLVVAAGGDVKAAVSALVRRGGPDMDSMIKAVLMAEGRIYRGAALPEGVAWAAHQHAVTGLDFEFSSGPGTVISRRARPPDPTLPPRAPLPPDIHGEEIGIDDIQAGLLVDAKHGAGALEEAGGMPFEPAWQRDTEPGVDVGIREAQRSAKIGTPSTPRTSRKNVQPLSHEERLLRQLVRQVDWAEHNGLKGVRWVCSSEERAAALRLLAERLPTYYRTKNIQFVVGGHP